MLGDPRMEKDMERELQLCCESPPSPTSTPTKEKGRRVSALLFKAQKRAFNCTTPESKIHVS